MKKFFTLLGAAGIALSASAQFSDDFEAYSVGDYIGSENATWTTWSGNTGGAEDVQVTAAEAHSGMHSIYFEGSAQGPQDVVLPFGDAYELGTFNFEMWFLLEEGSDSYFNFQAEEAIGTTWAADFALLANGTGTILNQMGLNETWAFPVGSWFKFSMVANLTLNQWTVSVDDVEQASFSNPINKIASLDIFPLVATAPTSNFYIDDVAFSYESFTPTGNNLAVVSATNEGPQLATLDNTMAAQVRNIGEDVITSFDATFSYNGNIEMVSVTGENIASLEFFDITAPSQYELIAGANDYTVVLSNINGNATDDNPADDMGTLTIDPVVPAAGKVVFGEEATGTWCPWCVRGDVFMNYMEDTYGDFWSAVAVHNEDPMVVGAYDDAIGGLIGGYPDGLVDRGPSVDPSAFEPAFLNRISQAPSATMAIAAEENEGLLRVSVTYTALEDFNQLWRVFCVLGENGVTGTTAEWAQANAYAGGANGEMGGYENLASPVPAADMVYNHVARAISPSFNGFAGFADGLDAGESKTFQFEFEISEDWNTDNMEIIATLVSSQGGIDNAGEAHYDDAIAAPLVDGELLVGVQELASKMGSTLAIYPNPAQDQASIAINLPVQSDVQLTILDVAGKIVKSGNYNDLMGTQVININTAALQSGVYLVQLQIAGQTVSKKMIVE